MNRLQNWLIGLFGGHPSSAEPGHTPETIDEEIEIAELERAAAVA
jgi:hypothetical protein